MKRSLEKFKKKITRDEAKANMTFEDEALKQLICSILRPSRQCSNSIVPRLISLGRRRLK